MTAGYYTATCRALEGLTVQLGFHFEPRSDAGALRELELFENGEREIEKSYRLFHQRLVQQFGEPTLQQRGPLGDSLPYCEWRLGSVSIVHYAMDRFGPEEHLTIRKGRGPLWSGPRAIGATVVSLGVLMLYGWCSAVAAKSRRGALRTDRRHSDLLLAQDYLSPSCALPVRFRTSANPRVRLAWPRSLAPHCPPVLGPPSGPGKPANLPGS